MSYGYQELDNSVYANGKAGWRGYGTVMPGAVSVDEAIKIAGLGYRVEKESVYRKINGTYRPLDHVGGLTVRMDLPNTDPRSDLGLVGREYTPVQHQSVFKMAEMICSEGGAAVETAGSLHNGKKVWMLLALPTGDNVKDDRIAKFLLITTAHDGTGAVQFIFTNVRVVCANTLAMAVTGAKHQYSVRHTEFAEDRIGEVIKVLSDSETYFKATLEKFEHWADTKVDPALAEIYVKMFKTTKAKSQTYAEGQQAEILGLFNGRQRGAHLQAVNGTAYGLYNAVTEWIDHKRMVRARRSKTEGIADRSPDEARFDSIMFGSGSQERQKAAYMVNELVRAIDDSGGQNEEVEHLMSQIDFGKTVTNKVLDDTLKGLDLGEDNGSFNG